MLLRIVSAFSNGVWHLIRLSETNTNVPGPITDDHDGAEAKATSALHHLGYAIYGYNPFL
jgi:hypothetical protein